MKASPTPSPSRHRAHPPLAYRIARLALRTRARLVRRERPRPPLDGLDFGDLADDAPNWLAQLTERSD